MASRFILSSLLATTIVALTGNAEAFAVKHTAGGNAVSWRVADVSWTIDSSVRKVAGGEDAVAAAVLAWTERGGAPSLAVANTGAQLEPGMDGTNGVFFVEGGFAPAGNALAVTILSFDDRTGEVLDADIVLNGKYQLGTVARGTTHPSAVTEPGGKTYDIGRVVAHEMGHALALSDEPADTSALMYPYVPRAVALVASPAADDVAGLTMLYGPAPSAELAQAAQTEHGKDAAGPALGCAVVAAPRPIHAPVTIYLAAGVALAALAMLRGARTARARRGAAGCTMLAAAALFVVPQSSVRALPRDGLAATFDAKAKVTHVSTTSIHGLFRSEIELSTFSCASNDCPSVSRLVTWGGTIDHVRQVIGGAHVPAEGDSVGLVLEQGVVSTIAPLEESSSRGIDE